mmetsp:Transcript_47352/g.131668  ORF Transcript_47352/g.131668 Transcript_47352/m.131668 type:complete len:124 (+) Transcript_47352:556-927(+)
MHPRTRTPQRIVADVATLEWMILADQAGGMTLPDEGREGAHSQLERLRAVRDERTIDGARELFTVAPSSLQLVDSKAETAAPEFDPALKPISNFVEFGNMDKEIAKAGLLSASTTASAMDEMD